MRTLLCLAILCGFFLTSSLRAQENKYEVKMDEDTKKLMEDAFKNLRFAWKITATFEVVSSNAMRREGNTLIWEYDFARLQKLASSPNAADEMGVKVVYKK